MLFNGKVWLGVLSGKTQPPVFLSGECVFEKAPIKERLRAFFAEAKESIIEAFESVREAAKQPDKRQHFIVGALIAFLVGVLAAPLGRFYCRMSCGNSQRMVGFKRAWHG